MPALSTEQLNRLERQLSDRERFLQEDIQREVDSREDFRQIAGEAPDTGDLATADLVIDLSHAEVSRDVAELREIAGARERVKAGEYGFCNDCGQDIPFERLQVQPTAERCTPCQALYEKTYANDGRGPKF